MATADKIKIAELEIGYKDVLEAQADLKERIRELNEETKLLEATQEVLRQGNRKDSEQYKENAKAIEANKTAVAGLQTEYKNNQRVLEGAISAKNEELGTIQKLDARNKELRASLRDLNLETDEGREKQKQYITEINKNTEFIRQNSDAAIQQKMNIGNYADAVKILIPEIKSLRARNEELKKAQKDLDLETEEGIKRKAEYSEEIMRNTQKINENLVVVAKQKISFSNLGDQLGSLPGPLKGAANGFQMLGNAAKAFLANPIVLAIAAIVGAVVGLFKAFKSTEEGGDRLKKKFDQIKAVVDVLRDRIENFALGLAKVFSGEQKLKDLKGTFKDMGDEMEREIRLAGELRDMIEQLENVEIDLLVTSAARRTEINRLREAAADQNKTEEQRIILLRRANQLIEEEAKAQQQVLLTKIANKLGTTDLEYAQMRLNSAREHGLQISLDEIGMTNSTNEDRRELNELIAQYIDLEGQAAMQKKEMASQISGLVKKELTEREKQLQDENDAAKAYYEAQVAAAEAEMLAEIELEKQKYAEKERLRQEDIAKQKQWDEDYATFRQEKALIDAENERIAREVEMNDRFQAELDALSREQEAEIAAALKTGASVSLITKKYAAIEKAIEYEKQQAKLAIIGSFAGSLAQLFGEETKLGKAAAITQTVINTYKGAMAAFAETPGGIIIKSAAAASAVATGVAAVRNIMKQGKGGGEGASISGVPGAGAGASQMTGTPQTTYVTNVSQPQTVLVLEEFQMVQGRQVQVKQAGEL